MPPIPGDTEENARFLDRIRTRKLGSTACVSVLQNYDQGVDPRIDLEVVTRNGWCLGMVIDWLNNRRASTFGEYWLGFMNEKRDHQIAFPMKGQKYSGKDGLSAIQGTMMSLMSTRKFKTKTITDKEAYEGKGYRITLAIGKAPYSIIALHGSQGGHAIGLIAQWGHDSTYDDFFVMDPNYGEIMIRTKKMLDEWLTAFLAEVGYSNTYPLFSIMAFE